mmetsp:Transcript_1921/g.6869  ORF Transcript_1921/g.6869 Transcript_1921/m.6869 type:complete len:599 (-) Transcript_1921:2147-3943(-)
MLPILVMITDVLDVAHRRRTGGTYSVLMSLTFIGSTIRTNARSVIHSHSFTACEELFVPKSPHIEYMMNGAEILGNGSGSHHSIKKLNTRVRLIQNASAKGGGAYVYSNSQGCDGGRLFMDGSALISCNGEIMAQSSQFSVKDVEVVTAVIDLNEIRAYRLVQHSRSAQSEHQVWIPRIKCDFALTSNKFCRRMRPSRPIEVYFHAREAEISYGTACYLWDYLRRSKTGGYFLPLSGGLDSSSVATIVSVMCQLVFKEGVENRNPIVLNDLREVCDKGSDWIPEDPKEIAGELFHTCYMGTENSSASTRELAKLLAGEIGAYHMDINIDSIVSVIVKMYSIFTGKTLRFEVHGGKQVEDLALQNVQARLRMILSYLFGQTLSWVRGKSRSKPLLVLASANQGECLRGYFTKYDCSSGDFNPIGAISKGDLRRFLKWSAENVGLKTLYRVLEAKPTAELRPQEAKQEDENDMGLTYDELDLLGHLRKAEGLGPVSMFKRLAYMFPDKPIEALAEKVKFFHTKYAINRHKMTTLTPTYHMSNENPEDSRYDLRPFLMNASWDFQFKQIDMLVLEYKHEDCEHADEDAHMQSLEGAETQHS